MSKPIIGLIPLVDEEKESYWMLPGYMKGIEEAGGIPIMLPLTDDENTISQIADKFDGFLFTGGHDVSPKLYGEDKLTECGEICKKRDEMEKILLKHIILLDKPLLGICRGIQIINVCLGGNLYQDIPTQIYTTIEHHQKPPYEIPVHKVEIVKNSPLEKLLGQEQLEVNSYHHQAIKHLSNRLKPMAYSEDRLIESVYMPDKSFVWAVQWHPEFLYVNDKNSKKLFNEFIYNCKTI